MHLNQPDTSGTRNIKLHQLDEDFLISVEYRNLLGKILQVFVPGKLSKVSVAEILVLLSHQPEIVPDIYWLFLAFILGVL